MRYPLTIHKLDLQQFSGNTGYVVFGPENVEEGVQARPKFTMTVAQWEDEGRPTDIEIEVKTVILPTRKADTTERLATSMEKQAVDR